MFIFFFFIVSSFSENRAIVFGGGKQNVQQKDGAKVGALVLWLSFLLS